MTPIYFAPLQGYTEAAYRDAHAEIFGGIDTYYTPFLRIERGDFRRKDVRDLEADNNHVPHLVPQLIAPNAGTAEILLALFREKGYEEADINLGCPFPLLAKRHNGAGMLPYPQEVEALLGVVRQNPGIRFSVKMRLGWDNPGECLDLLPLLNELPLQHITLHPRLGSQQYKGTPNLDAFAAFADRCRHPLVYNGNLNTLAEIQHIEQRFPRLKALMIGRGLLQNPALALEYQNGTTLSAGEFRQKLYTLHTAVYTRYAEQLQGGDNQLLAKMKPFWDYLAPTLDRKTWKAIHKSGSLNNYQAAVRLLQQA